VNSTAIPAVSKEITSAPRNAPPVVPPKKPALGDVRLATPSVNRAADSAQGGEAAAPSIDASQPSSGEPFTLSGSHSKEPTAPLPIGGDVVSAKLLKSVPPVYPPAARSQRVGGDVKIDALIDVSGNVSTMKVISGPTLLHQAAMSALKQWKYEPAKLDGNPTPMHLTVIVQFRLQ
jgi:protein TonB